jgi:hypothetical protein
MLGRHLSQQCDLYSIVTRYNEIDSTVGPAIGIADEIADTVDPDFETVVCSENGPDVGPHDFLRLRIQTLSLASSVNAGSIKASVFAVISVCKVNTWDITDNVSRFQLKQETQNMEAAPFIGSLRGNMIAGQSISDIFIGLFLHDQISSGGLRTHAIYGDQDGHHSGDLCDVSDQMLDTINPGFGPSIGTAIRQGVYHTLEILSDEDGPGNGPAAYSAIHPLVLKLVPDIGLKFVARTSSGFDDLSTSALLGGILTLDLMLTRDLVLLGGILIVQFDGQLTRVAPYVVLANEVEMHPEDDKFQPHSISATIGLQVGPIPIQQHANNEFSYIMANAKLMRIYEKSTSYVLYLYYSANNEKCFDDKHIVDISIENERWDAIIQVKSGVVNIIGTATEPVDHTYLGYARTAADGKCHPEGNTFSRWVGFATLNFHDCNYAGNSENNGSFLAICYSSGNYDETTSDVTPGNCADNDAIGPDFAAQIYSEFGPDVGPDAFDCQLDAKPFHNGVELCPSDANGPEICTVFDHGNTQINALTAHGDFWLRISAAQLLTTAREFRANKVEMDLFFSEGKFAYDSILRIFTVDAINKNDRDTDFADIFRRVFALHTNILVYQLDKHELMPGGMMHTGFDCGHLFVNRVDTGSTDIYLAVGPLLLDGGTVGLIFGQAVFSTAGSHDDPGISVHGNNHIFVQGYGAGSLNLQDRIYAASLYAQTNGFSEEFVLTLTPARLLDVASCADDAQTSDQTLDMTVMIMNSATVLFFRLHNRSLSLNSSIHIGCISSSMPTIFLVCTQQIWFIT